MKKVFSIFIYIFTVIFFSLHVFAETSSVTLSVKKEEIGNFYRYEFADGKGFSTNVSESGASVDFAIFNFDEEIKWQFLYNGKETEYNTGDVLIDNGSYVLIAYEGDMFAYCNFSIDNSLDEVDGDFGGMDEDEFMVALLKELKEEDPETFDNIDSFDDITMTPGDEEDVDEYIDSDEFMDDIYKSLFGDELDDDSLAEMIMGKEVDNAPLTLKYDDELSMYIYEMPNSAKIYTSIPNNAITQYGVQIFFRDDASAEIVDLQTGEETDYTSGDIVSREGNYEVVIKQIAIFDDDVIENAISFDDSGDSTLSSIDSNTYIAHYFFTILRNPTGRLEIVNAPSDFIISGVTMSGQELERESDNMYVMKKDGIYEFILSCKDDENIKYTFSVERDTKKPKLNITEGALEGLTHESVEWNCLNSEDEVKVKYNYKEVTMSENKVSGYGVYKITVTNNSGNTQVYSFRILPKHDTNSVLAVILLSMLGVAAAGYLVLSKKDTEVL